MWCSRPERYNRSNSMRPYDPVFRIVRLIALAIWVGGLVFFGFVAAVAFSTLPDAHSAGAVVRGSLIALHHIGLTAGIVYLLLTLALLATQRDSHPVRGAELVLVIAMLVLTTLLAVFGDSANGEGPDGAGRGCDQGGCRMRRRWSTSTICTRCRSGWRARCWCSG